MHACMHIHTYIHTYVVTYMHTCIHTYIHIYIYVHSYTHTHTHTNIYVEASIYTYTSVVTSSDLFRRGGAVMTPLMTSQLLHRHDYICHYHTDSLYYKSLRIVDMIGDCSTSVILHLSSSSSPSSSSSSPSPSSSSPSSSQVRVLHVLYKRVGLL